MNMKSITKQEYGDFQTPLSLASEITAFLQSVGVNPEAVVEPTCGEGAFLASSVEVFDTARAFHGFEVNSEYVSKAKAILAGSAGRDARIRQQDFFDMDWRTYFSSLPDNLLVIGNPPWVTNAAIGAIGGTNLPQKSNFQNHGGFAAKTGKANFDISEWMLIRLLEALDGKQACLAMLCKTATARKVLRHAWINQFGARHSSIHLIDAKKHFGASVDACLLVVRTGCAETVPAARVYDGLHRKERIGNIGIVGNELIADVEEYESLKDLDGREYYKWRSGVKHDAARVMEFVQTEEGYANGFGEHCCLESTYLHPLLKSSDIANQRLKPRRYVLTTQRTPTDDTSDIESLAPLTWQYLLSHADLLDRRKSIIYKKRPRFSIFGIGDYSFAPWKVAVSGLYKNIKFSVLGSVEGKAILVDDTCYFISCREKAEAECLCSLLNSDMAHRFFRSLVFFDSKRPVNMDVLKRLDLCKLAEHLGRDSELKKYIERARLAETDRQLLLFDKGDLRPVSASCSPGAE